MEDIYNDGLSFLLLRSAIFLNKFLIKISSKLLEINISLFAVNLYYRQFYNIKIYREKFCQITKRKKNVKFKNN
jgi:hypothetical protein